jgi:hypothetical protein
VAEPESQWACPVCGAHRLAMEELPRVGAMGAQPYADILGMGDPADRSMPAIVCLQCSTRWPNADAFWAAANATAEPAEADAEAVARDGATGDGAASDSATSDARPEPS